MPKISRRRRKHNKVHPVEIEYEYDTDEHNEGYKVADRIKSKKKNKKRKKVKSSNNKKKKKRKRAMNVINITVPKNSKVIISNSESSTKIKSKSESKSALSDVLLENMIQQQHELFSQLNSNTTQTTHPTTSECNALATNCNQKTEEDEDTKLEIDSMQTVEIKPSLTPTTHCSHQLIVPQNQHPNRDHNASFASTMNGHLLHFHEEERLEIANEYPQVMTEHEYDVLDLDESIYACSDFKEDLPSISEMSFHSWSLPQSHHEREHSHFKHEEIIDSFLKNNEFEITRSRRKQQKFTPRLSQTTASESMHGIDDIFDSVRRQTNENDLKKKKKAKQKKKGKQRKKKKKKKKKLSV